MEPKPLDVNSWSVLSMPDLADRFATGLDWASDPAGPPKSCLVRRNGLWGYGFSTESRSIWPEGTAQMALAWQSRAKRDVAQGILRNLDAMQRQGTSPDDPERGALPAGYPERVDTGFKEIVYYPYPHIGATAWYIMAERGYNPFTGRVVDR